MKKWDLDKTTLKTMYYQQKEIPIKKMRHK